MILPVLLLCSSLKIAANQPCWESAKFSSKTPYKLVRNLNTSITPPAHSCQPVQINMVLRHGERYPTKKDARRMISVAKKVNLADGKSKANLVLPYTSPFREIDDGRLAAEGEAQIFELGARIRERFAKDVFSREYSPLTYRFQSSCTGRTTATASALAMGLFGGTGRLGAQKGQPISLEVPGCEADRWTRFGDNCLNYKVNVDDNVKAMEEFTKFTSGYEMKNVLRRVNAKLNLTNLTLSYDDVSALFSLCAWEIAFQNGPLDQGICSLFSEEDRNVLEYAEDIQAFYKNGPVYQIASQMSCELVKDIYTSLRRKANRTSDGEYVFDGVFRVGHSETIAPLYSALGLFPQTPPLRADSYLQNLNRVYRFGCMAPMSANLYFVLWLCDGVIEPKIQLYVNEQLTQIPCCPSTVDCDLRTFEDCYKQQVESCDFINYCQVKKEIDSRATHSFSARKNTMLGCLALLTFFILNAIL